MISQPVPSPAEGPRPVAAEHALRLAIEAHYAELLTTIRVYVWKFHLTFDKSQVDELAHEVLQETVVTALRRADVYDPTRPALAWLRAIALNTTRSVKKARESDARHVLALADTPQVRATGRQRGEMLTEDEMYDLLSEPTSLTALGQPELDEWLALVKPSDGEVLRLAFQEDLRGEALAAALGTSVGCAWSRLSRALTHLRQAYTASQAVTGEGI